jgi:hypothetical protein
VIKHSLAGTMQEMRSEQIQVIAVFLNHLLRTPPQRIHLSERLDLIQEKRTYAPAHATASPQVPRCVKVRSGCVGATGHAPPTTQAPFICQLCSDGFVATRDLWKDATKQHYSLVENRKRLIFEVQQCKALPLQPIEKRRVANFCAKTSSALVQHVTRCGQTNAPRGGSLLALRARPKL